MSIEQFLVPGFHAKSAPTSPVDFSGEWTNDLGSEMELTSTPGGAINGVYRTNVGSPAPTEEFDLVGFSSGDLIAFVVNFGKYGSLTAWAGQHTDKSGAETIYTLWHLAKNIQDADEPTQLWAGILAGANEFRRK